MIILIILVTFQITENEGRPVDRKTEATLNVDPQMYNRTAQLIILVSRLDDDEPVDPESTDFRKQYYPDHESYLEDFNFRFNDTEKPLDLYRDMVKLLLDTNQQGITGTVQHFATSQPPAPMRKSVRRRRVENPEVIEQYRRKSKKHKKQSTSSSDDGSDDESDESLGYRRTFDSRENVCDRTQSFRRMMEIETNLKPVARVSELNFGNVPSSRATSLRSLDMDGDTEKKDFWTKEYEDEKWDSLIKGTNWDNQDVSDKRNNDWYHPTERKKYKHKTGWDEPVVAWNKKTSKKWNEQKNNNWDNVGTNINKNTKWELNDEIWNNKDKIKKTGGFDEPLNANVWDKQEQTSRENKKKAENDWDKPKSKGRDELKKIKKLDWDKPLTIKKGIKDYDTPKKNPDKEWSKSQKKESWDSYGDKKVKDYDDDDNSKKKEKEEAGKKNSWDNLGEKKKDWDDYDKPKKSKHQNNDKKGSWSKPKKDEWDNIGRSKKDDWGKKDIRERKQNKKYSWDDKPTNEDGWNDRPMKNDDWESKQRKKSSLEDKTPIIKGSGDDKPIKNDMWDKNPIKKDKWHSKRIKKDSWEDNLKKNDKNDQWEKVTKGWTEAKTTGDWNPPPTRKRKHDDNDYYERPRNKHGKRHRDMLNVRTSIPFIGKRGIYEEN